MSGITPLIDTLLATRLSQRVDLVPLKSALEVSDPGAVSNIQQLSNDIRLPSLGARLQTAAALQINSTLGSKGSAAAPALLLQQNETLTLSVAVRALDAVLQQVDDSKGQVQGVKPLWPGSQPPAVAELAASMSQVVATSGLFYESHLRQFASGERTLEQLKQEPQARLEQGATSAEKTSSTTPDAARSSALTSAGIHLDAMALVRQQLDLLATPVFRWSGQAWPGASLNWEIQQEQGDQAAGAEVAAAQPAWNSRLVIDLPTLKAVEVRLSLVGDQLQLRMAAREEATQSLLGMGQDELAQQLKTQGLQLTGLQIEAMPAVPVAPADSGGADVTL